jgi:ribonuclease HIII
MEQFIEFFVQWAMISPDETLKCVKIAKENAKTLKKPMIMECQKQFERIINKECFSLEARKISKLTGEMFNQDILNAKIINKCLETLESNDLQECYEILIRIIIGKAIYQTNTDLALTIKKFIILGFGKT